MVRLLLTSLVILTAPTAAQAITLTESFTGPKGAPPNPTYWNYDRGGGGWGNRELQRYTNRRSNSRLTGQGQLEIVARKKDKQYTSARLTSKDKVEFKYGTVSVRAKLPQGRGLWPAFWLLGADLPRVDWPYCGEIDIMENLGDNPNKAYGTVHGPGSMSDQGVGGFYLSPVALSAGYHLYTVSWQQDHVAFFVDGIQYAEVSRATYPAGQQWALNRKMFIILNLAIGGQWPGRPDQQTHFPAKLLVDEITVTAS